MTTVYFANKCLALLDQIDQVGSDLNIQTPIEVTVRMSMSVPCAGGSTIVVPYLFLIESEDLPSHLRVVGFDDPKLDDEAYLNELRQWTLDTYRIIDTNPITEFEKRVMKTFALFLRDSVESKNAKTFVLRHEASHLLHDHKDGNGDLIRFFMQPFHGKYTILASLAAALGSSISSFFLSTSPSWILSVAIAAYTSAVAIQIFTHSYRSISCEKQADLTAIQDCEKARTGGIYLFQTMREVNLRERNKSLYGKILFNSRGDCRITSFTHPTESERIAYMSQKEVNPSKSLFSVLSNIFSCSRT